jgi:hypothetical protein
MIGNASTSAGQVGADTSSPKIPDAICRGSLTGVTAASRALVAVRMSGTSATVASRLRTAVRLRRYRQYQEFYDGRHFERLRNGRSTTRGWRTCWVGG